MSLRSPNLDDRSWQDLMDAALARIRRDAPEWTDLSAGDPGVVLLDAFAFLTEALIYRLNQVPAKLYVEFLRLMGIRLRAPGAAIADLVFRRTGEVKGPIEIPAGTRVTIAATGGGLAPVFATTQDVSLAAGADEISVRAVNAESVDAEQGTLAGGPGGACLALQRPPVIAPTGEPGDLIVAVEAMPGELAEGDPARRYGDKDYRVWRETEAFVELTDPRTYIADRLEGVILFSPLARWSSGDVLEEQASQPGAIPGAGRDIKVWYRRGGGPDGNVAPGLLTTLVDPIPGLVVSNPKAATGGTPAETIENAIVRGPQEFHARGRAVTARDYELLAVRASGDVARCRAFTKADLWRYARPGTVELALVPRLPRPEMAAQVTIEQLLEVQTGRAIQRVLDIINTRRPLATSVEAQWAGYKAVRVRARVTIQFEEDEFEVRRRVDERIHATVNPLPVGDQPGWPFGQPLYASSVLKIMLAEPGVQHVTDVSLVVDDSPAVEVKALAADPLQPSTWYAGSNGILFRSLNHGDGWEAMHRVPGETVSRIAPHPSRAGLVAMSTDLPELHSKIWLSDDGGAHWRLARQADWLIEDLAWVDVGKSGDTSNPTLLMATTAGLYAISIREGATFQEVTVDPKQRGQGLAAVASFVNAGGETTVAVAVRKGAKGGVWLSTGINAVGEFRPIGLNEPDIRVLAIQTLGSNAFLWVGLETAEGGGGGCHRWHLLGKDDPPDKWVQRSEGWSGGSCHAIAFLGDTALAGTHDQGVLWLDATKADAAWSKPSLKEERRTLPLRDDDKKLFEPIFAVAADERSGVVMVGGPVGIWRNREGEPSYRADEARYENISHHEFVRWVTIPPTWLFVNGQNDIEIAKDVESRPPLEVQSDA
jgi:Baseplate J-like protein